MTFNTCECFDVKRNKETKCTCYLHVVYSFYAFVSLLYCKGKVNIDGIKIKTSRQENHT